MTGTDPRLLFFGISITDWIQAIGAFIAIIAAFWGFVKLFLKNKDLQNQIDSLKMISEQSINQSKSLAEQVDQMMEGNKIQRESYQLMKLYFTSDMQDKEFHKKEIDLRKQEEKFINKPKLIWENQMILSEKIDLTLLNQGEVARILDFKELPKNTVNHNLKPIPEGAIEKNGQFKISFTAKPFGLSPRECYVEIDLIISDKFGNKYSQLIEGPTERIIIKPPKEIESE